MSATMATIERWLGNPVTRFLLQWLSSDCSRCGNRLDMALDPGCIRNQDLWNSLVSEVDVLSFPGHAHQGIFSQESMVTK